MQSCCCGSVRRYAAAVAAGRVMIDGDETRLPLRHSHHRYEILGSDGSVQTLTVPLARATATMATPMREVLVAEHGRWRQQHWGALYSAYGRTPFFDYAAPSLHRILVDGRQRFLLDLNNELQDFIIDFAALPLEIVAAGDDVAAPATVVDVPYYQLWSDRAGGFTPGLSVLDLVFNCGNEAVLTLLAMTGKTC